ncbi:MAG TPA: chromate resistance protein ChrB domain-containing protein [Burkholderiales bacterium]|nr:chromate resistance protein ChrB domain-containing protein [Burkholderiales bacterium]
MTAYQALVLSLPTRNSTVRMRVWRALKETGCGVLRDGVYLLPAGSPRAPTLTEMESDIRAEGGFAMAVEMNLKSSAQAEHVRKLFDRSMGYGGLVEKIRAASAALPRLGLRRAQTLVQRLRRSFEELAESDFFPGPAKSQAEDALGGLEAKSAELYSGGEPRPSRKRIKRVDAAKYRGRIWATRSNPWVDRLASAWLIKRFIDGDARFVWIERPRDCPRKAVGFDFDRAEFTHSGGRVTFEVLLASFGLDQDPPLAAIGAAVHFLDIGGIPVADARGLETVLRGAKQKARSDDQFLSESMRIFDFFYSAYGKERPDRA